VVALTLAASAANAGIGVTNENRKNKAKKIVDFVMKGIVKV
jgi:hypothetical protein